MEKLSYGGDCEKKGEEEGRRGNVKRAGRLGRPWESSSFDNRFVPDSSRPGVEILAGRDMTRGINAFSASSLV